MKLFFYPRDIFGAKNKLENEEKKFGAKRGWKYFWELLFTFQKLAVEFWAIFTDSMFAELTLLSRACNLSDTDNYDNQGC